MTAAHLASRSLIRLSGKDAGEFLQALITTDVEQLPAGEARPGALLTPQGKILFDFLIWRDGDGFVIETDTAQRDGLIRRLTMYKLRAAVDIAAAGDGVTVFWDADATRGAIVDGGFAKAGIAVSRTPALQDGAAASADAAGNLANANEEAYHQLRVGAGLVVSGADFALQDAFPHDILLDRSGGLSFRKGCYVGQEVVSRMQHRGTARRRVVLVESDAPLPASRTEITAAQKPVGTLGSAYGTKGLSIVRIDRVADALRQNIPLLAAGVPVTLTLPSWSELAFPAESQEAES